MTKLYICEKASVGRALADVLPGVKAKKDNSISCGDDIVAWASGHLLELCEPEDYDESFKRWGPDTLLYVPERWKRKEISRTKTLLSGIKKLLKNADVVVNVGDADREGQLLIDEILEYLGWTGKTERLRFSDLNPDAIRKALGNVRDNSEFRGEFMAGQARMYADWLVGLALTRYVTVSLRNAGYKAEVMSVGRVQTPTLGLAVERDREIENFSPSPYYELTAVLALDGDRKLGGRWVPKDADSESLDARKRITDKEFAAALVKKIDGAEGVVTSVTKKAHKVSPPLPYSLPKLQMAASKKHGVTDTLVHVQKLYESGYVTYPRTGCEYIPEGHFPEAEKILDAIRAGCPGMADMLTGADKSRKGPAWDDKKITEHHAILPTARIPAEGALSEEERKIYELICARYVMQFLEDYEYEETIAGFRANGEVFRAVGRTVIHLGWQGWDAQNEKERKEDSREEADESEGRETDTVLPLVRQGETGITRASADERMTKPPKPFTYHGLIQAMNGIHAYVKDPEIRAKLKELQGIGTEATQENIIAVLFKRGYLEKKKKTITSTELGRTLIDILSAGKAAALTSPDMTALWEQTMSGIEAGSASLESFIAEAAGMVKEIISVPLAVPPDIPGMERRPKKREESGETVEAPCPLNCGGKARRCSGKFGYYWRCSCSTLTFKDADGRPAIREARIETFCLIKGCKGKAVQFASKKDGRLFWKCPQCGNFFDDADGKPKLRNTPGKKQA